MSTVATSSTQKADTEEGEQEVGEDALWPAEARADEAQTPQAELEAKTQLLERGEEDGQEPEAPGVPQEQASRAARETGAQLLERKDVELQDVEAEQGEQSPHRGREASVQDAQLFVPGFSGHATNTERFVALKPLKLERAFWPRSASPFSGGGSKHRGSPLASDATYASVFTYIYIYYLDFYLYLY